ncbi:MAG: chromate transporter [Alphaproteobacteria bacterium]|nr:chromate transporter [Alphaproteobacteria bacterium]
MKILWDLFFSCFKVGLFTFGGGAAMLPLLQAEFAERKKWVSEKDLLDYYAIGQCTPGIIAINTATFIGYNKGGILGAVIATLGMVMPSLIIILLIASILRGYMDNPYVIHAFAGIRIVVVALIANAVVGLWKNGIRNIFSGVIFILSLLLLVFADFSPVMIVLVALLTGYLYQIWQRRKL